MNRRPSLDTADVVAMLAAFGDRSPEQVDDVVGSLELTWLIAELEQRYDVVVGLNADELDAVRTVADATRVLGAVLDADAAARHEGPALT